MKHLFAKSLLALGTLIAIISFNACQKETALNPANQIKDEIVASDRSAGGITYGVTLFNGASACRIVGVNEGTGNVTTSVPAFYTDPSTGITTNLDNLKGICYTAWGQWFITTGAPATIGAGPSIYDNALYKVNPTTGQTSYFGSVSALGTVSDLEYDPYADVFVGLLNNTNNTITISPDINGNYTIYAGPFAVTGLNPGYTLQGLSLVNDASGKYYIGAATRPGGAAPAQLYRVSALTGGLSGYLTDLAPVANFSNAHVAIGFDRQLNHLAVNRAVPPGSLVSGLSEVRPWVVPLGPVTPTNFWGAVGVNFEDLSSYVY